MVETSKKERGLALVRVHGALTVLLVGRNQDLFAENKSRIFRNSFVFLLHALRYHVLA